MKDDKIFDKLVYYLQQINQNYEYTQEHFILEQTDNGIEIKNWTLLEQAPSINFIKNIDLGNFKKKVPKNSMEDIIRRLEKLEKDKV